MPRAAPPSPTPPANMLTEVIRWVIREVIRGAPRGALRGALRDALKRIHLREMHPAHLVGLISAFTLLLRLHRSRGGHRDARAGRPRGSPQPPPGLGAACRERRGAVVSAVAVRTPERHSWSRAAAVDAPSAAGTAARTAALTAARTGGCCTGGSLSAGCRRLGHLLLRAHLLLRGDDLLLLTLEHARLLRVSARTQPVRISGYQEATKRSSRGNPRPSRGTPKRDCTITAQSR